MSDDMIIYLIVVLAAYVYFAYSLQRIANRTNTENSWMAWIPVLNAVLMCRVARRSAWFVLSFFIPLINILAMAFIWGEIAGNLNKSKWLGLLNIIPVANLILPGYLAFSE